MSYLLLTVAYAGLMLWHLSNQAGPQLHQCHACGGPVYARPYIPFFCPSCKALVWF